MNHLLLGALLAFSMATIGCKNKDASNAAPSPDEQAAVTAAETWLALVDGGKYSDSYDQAASYFKGAVTSDQWQAQVAGVRKPLGDLVSRKVESTHATTSLPGAPDGKYVVIQFNAVFANKASAVETVTPMMDSDGSWRVSGYYIR